MYRRAVDEIALGREVFDGARGVSPVATIRAAWWSPLGNWLVTLLIRGPGWIMRTERLTKQGAEGEAPSTRPFDAGQKEGKWDSVRRAAQDHQSVNTLSRAV